MKENKLLAGNFSYWKNNKNRMTFEVKPDLNNKIKEKPLDTDKIVLNHLLEVLRQAVLNGEDDFRMEWEEFFTTFPVDLMKLFSWLKEKELSFSKAEGAHWLKDPDFVVISWK